MNVPAVPWEADIDGLHQHLSSSTASHWIQPTRTSLQDQRGCITKCHGLGDLNDRHLLSHSSGSWKVQDQGPVGFGF